MSTRAIETRAVVKITVALLAVACAGSLGVYGSAIRLPVLAVIAVFFSTLGISFVRGTEGLYLVIVAMLFSPEVSSGATTGRTTGEAGGIVALRLEDLVMIAVVLGWMLRSAYTGRRFGILRSPVNMPIWAYMAASIVATLLGVLAGSVRYPRAAFFNNLKYFEYFLLYFMIVAHVRDKTTVVRMLWALFIVFFFAMMFGYGQIGTGDRVSAPFDAEPNTFGGYIVLLICVAGGIALIDQRARIRVLMVVLILFAVPPLLFTLSRASYLALIVALLSFLAVSRHRILIGAVAVGLVAVIVLGLPVFPEQVRERVTGTFREDPEFRAKIGPVTFDASSSARIIAYHEAWNKWIKRPVFGYGVTGTGFLDAQYPRVLVETGFVGLAAFLFIFWRLLRQVWKTFREAQDPFLRGAAMGFFCGIVAMLGHGIAANSFIIIRIAEPFWLLAGLILVIPRSENPVPEPALSPSFVRFPRPS